MTVRIGIVGAGGQATEHMRNLLEIDDAEIVGICDVVEARARDIANEYGGRAYTSQKEMYAKEDIDAVYICVPPFAHGEPELLAAEVGVAVFVEKPVAVALDLALEIKTAFDSAGLITSVGYQVRYAEAVARAKSALEGKTIGMVFGQFMSGLPGPSWWRVLAESGGQFVEQTTHVFDLARYLIGDVVKVSAATALRALGDVPNLDVPDVGSALVWFENGAIGTISNCCLFKGVGVPDPVGLRVLCSDLTIDVWDWLIVNTPERTEEFRPKRSGWAVVDECFVRAVATNNQALVRSSYGDAVKTLAVTLGANESWQTGKIVEVKF